MHTLNHRLTFHDCFYDRTTELQTVGLVLLGITQRGVSVLASLFMNSNFLVSMTACVYSVGIW